MEAELSLPKPVCPACRVCSKAHSWHQVDVSPQGTPPATTIRVLLVISAHHQLPRNNPELTWFKVLCPSLGSTCQALSGPWPWREAGLRWDMCSFADAFSSLGLFSFLRRIHSREASLLGLFPLILLSLVQGDCFSTAARS